MAKYNLPEFLQKEFNIKQDNYNKWLNNKAQTHYRRDKNYFKNFPSNIKPQHYKLAIHNAVIHSDGKCFYTDEKLDWNLINKFGEDRNYSKKYFHMLPTVEHIDRSSPNLCFAITSWKVNDAKNDLDIEDFFALCDKIVFSEETIRKKINNTKKCLPNGYIEC